ncbi:MAG: hypothetical protein IM333_15860 [Microcystis sp. M048S1]|uniref:hypothetical protein n=1 Tax=unclassified Microcystis TaxID=2643300 RepID=UPI001191629E|nr:MULTISPECIES: hypothetical protein [unclassified Microcystis]MCA2903181.1 hypothetical protein [Microcystis sp. M035S1]MCA2722118.1 hypothetical protein [Microcystis sp. M176S2]MCA2726500.1 hypothetical protein [Microcystis sp. M166S2]MCA2728833.1 hypothetical protein [Microcystis sp. M162S2]MCA2747372.1 hypothetical protein [Microcystis sp. M155S2]
MTNANEPNPYENRPQSAEEIKQEILSRLDEIDLESLESITHLSGSPSIPSDAEQVNFWPVITWTVWRR